MKDTPSEGSRSRGRLRWLVLLALVLTLGLVVVACGGDDDDSAAPAPAEPAPEEAPAPEPAPEEAPEPAPEEAPAPEPAPEEPAAAPEGCQVEGADDDGVIRAFGTQDISGVIGALSQVHSVRAVELWTAQIASEGGILGCDFVIEWVDEPFDAVDPAPCLANYRDAISSGNYHFYFGPVSSACMFALPDLTKAAGQFLFSGIAADHQPYMENYADQGPYIAHPTVSTFLEGRTVAEWAVANGFKRTAVMVPNYAYGQDVGSSFVSYYEAICDDCVVVDQQFPEAVEDDFTPFINAMVGQDPDLIITAFFGNLMVPFWSDWKATGNDQDITTVAGLIFSSTFEVPGVLDAVSDNTFGYNRGDWHIRCTTPVGETFCNLWSENYADSDFPIPGSFAFVYVADIQMARSVIETTGTLDPDAWVALIESGEFTYDSPYNPNPTPVNPVNHMSDGCAEVGAIVVDPNLPVYTLTYDAETLFAQCMRDVLPAEEVRSLTDNPNVSDEALDVYLANQEANAPTNPPNTVTTVPGQ